MRLVGTALITGATSGIGREFALQLAAKGVNLVLVARDVERLTGVADELKRQFCAHIEILRADLATSEGVSDVRARLERTDDPITILVNNAGSGLYEKLAVTNFEPTRRAIELMGITPMELGGLAAHNMKQLGYGVIITTASVEALVPMGSYAAIKAMVKVWSDSLALELKGTGVHVLTFLPGWTRTEFHQRSGVSNSSIPHWVWLDADRVVHEALEAVEHGKTTLVPSKRFKTIATLAKHGPMPIVSSVVAKLNKGRR